MNGKETIYAVLAVILIWAAWRLFKDDSYDGPTVRDVWELDSPDPFGKGIDEGLITPQQVIDIAASDSAVFIGKAVAHLQNAPGLLDDNEAEAVSACKLRTYPEQLAFGSTFYKVTGQTVSDFLYTFMSNGDELNGLAQYVIALRP